MCYIQWTSKIDITTLAKKLKDSSFIPSLRKGPTGKGFTLETSLGIFENNKDDYDFIDTGLYSGIAFELKAQHRIMSNPSKNKDGRKIILEFL